MDSVKRESKTGPGLGIRIVMKKKPYFSKTIWETIDDLLGFAI